MVLIAGTLLCVSAASNGADMSQKAGDKEPGAAESRAAVAGAKPATKREAPRAVSKVPAAKLETPKALSEVPPAPSQESDAVKAWHDADI
jgi:poly(3-hydroxybutyrate) depolymerase